MPSSRPQSSSRRSEPASGPRLLKMLWSNRLSLHWSVDVETLRESVPSQLEIDTYKGNAWLGVIAFRVRGLRPILTPAMPGLSSFNELDVCTAVKHRGERGVFFFSVDASSSVAVWTARTFLHLPYFRASIQMSRRVEALRFASKRVHQSAQAADFECTWTVGKSLPPPRPGDLSHFLTERRQTFTTHRGRVFVCQLEHDPLPLREAKITKLQASVIAAAGLPMPDGSPLAFHSDSLAVDMCSMREPGMLEAGAGLLEPAMVPPAGTWSHRKAL